MKSTWIIFIIFVLAGCSTLHRDRIDMYIDGLAPEERAANREQARQILAEIKKSNINLKSFKGIGRFTLRKGSQYTQSERIAWIGAPPNRLKVIVLAFGRPTIKVATDGRFLYLVDFSSSSQPFHKLRTTDANLKNILSIPIKSSEILELLRGRIPTPDYSDIGIIHQDDTHPYTLLLTQKWKGVVAKIVVNPELKEVQSIEKFARDGRLIYRARFVAFKTINGYRVPARLVLSNEDGVSLRLDIERYLPDVDVDPQMFVLTPPTK